MNAWCAASAQSSAVLTAPSGSAVICRDLSGILIDLAGCGAHAGSLQLFPNIRKAASVDELRTDYGSPDGVARTDLLRVRGLVAVEECRRPVVVHFVQHVAHPPVELEEWPDGDRRSRLVFVTRGLAREPVAQLFASVAQIVTHARA
jgi:hypothetical protein